MSQPLFPVVEVPDFISEDSQYDTQYKRSMKWDPELGDFVRDGAHRIKECDGKEAFAIWCFKIAQTERYRCLAYPIQSVPRWNVPWITTMKKLLSLWQKEQSQMQLW